MHGAASLRSSSFNSEIRIPHSTDIFGFTVRRFNACTRRLLCLWSKDMLRPTPTMNRVCSKICAAASLFYIIFIVLALTSNLENMPHSSIPLMYLQTVTVTVCFTFTAVLVFLRSLLVDTAHKTTSMFGVQIYFLIGVTNLVELLGAAPYVATFNGRCGSLVRNGEWIVCLPLVVCAFGHVFNIQERLVLIGAAFQGIASVALCISSISTSKVGICICGSFCALLLVPGAVVLFKVSSRSQRDSSIRVQQVLEMWLYGWASILMYILYAGFYFSNVLGVVPFEWGRIFVVCFDLVWVIFLFFVLLEAQLRSDVGSMLGKGNDPEGVNAELKSFLHFVFHEVRVPFHSLLLGLEHLASQSELGGHQSLLAMLIQSAEMMHHTINDVLLLSRLEDKKLELEVAPFSVPEMTKSVLQTFQPLINEKKIILALQIDPGFPQFLLGDQHWISEVLANLISNGLKFSKEGQALDVFLNVLALSFDTCYFQMKVQDEGMGITIEDQQLLFLPVSQMRSTQNQFGKGSGLGLNIVKHIVELHKGTISVSSELGKGSTFFVKLKLPIFNAADRERDQSSSESDLEQDTHTNFSELEHEILEQQSGPTLELRKKLPHQNEVPKQMTSTLKGQEVPQYNQKSNKILPSDLPFHENLGKGVSNAPPEVSKMKQLSRTFGATSYLQTSPKNSSSPSSESETCQKTQSNITESTRKAVTFVSQPLDEKLHKKQNAQKCIQPVLVVDDSPMNRKLTRLILEQQGFIVDEACNGLEAVQMAKEKKYWTIFMDNQMPVMNGIEATRRITEVCNCVVIGLTGNSLDEDVFEFMNAGAREVLIKPCKREIILRVLSQLDNSISDSVRN